MQAIRSPKYRALAMVLYGAGLRISEAVRLEVGDINSARMVIHVRDGNGEREDPLVALNEALELPKKAAQMLFSAAEADSRTYLRAVYSNFLGMGRKLIVERKSVFNLVEKWLAMPPGSPDRDETRTSKMIGELIEAAKEVVRFLHPSE